MKPSVSKLVNGAFFMLNIAHQRIHPFLGFLNTQPEYKGRTGAYFSIRSQSTGLVLATAAVGVPPVEKMEKYFSYSLEKGKRLFGHPEHLTSHESKNEAKNEFAGAAKINSLYIFSCSGFSPDKADTLFCLDVALCGQLMKNDDDEVDMIMVAGEITKLKKKYDEYFFGY